MTDLEPGREPRPAWARETGWLDLTAGGPVGAGGDRAAVVERVHRYGWAFDERRRDLLGECFTAEGVWEASIMGRDRVGPIRGRDAVADWLAEFWPQQRDQRRHVLTNTVVRELTPRTATVLAYLVLTAAEDGAVRTVTTGCYRFQLELDSDRTWRIAHLFAGFDVPF